MASIVASGMHSIIEILSILFLSGAAVLRTWIACRKCTIRENARTERFSTAIDGSQPEQRPEIIRACSDLENGGCDTAASDQDETLDGRS